jgi:hypothetical protein
LDEKHISNKYQISSLRAAAIRYETNFNTMMEIAQLHCTERSSGASVVGQSPPRNDN